MRLKRISSAALRTSCLLEKLALLSAPAIHNGKTYYHGRSFRAVVNPARCLGSARLACLPAIPIIPAILRARQELTPCPGSFLRALANSKDIAFHETP
jgi:hypothetical protein